MDRRPDIDILFCAHTGLEGSQKLSSFIAGSLLDHSIKMKLWRVPAGQIPREPEARLAWLNEWWERIDQWIEDNRE